MFLGIEIGGTKLQFGVGLAENGMLTALERANVQPANGAEGIRRQIVEIAGPLVRQYGVRAIGIGFGGPVDLAAGRIVKSHHVAGWDGFPLAGWCHETFGLPSSLANDSDMAGLGEARFGGGRGKKVVFYTNVGTGIGGALVIGGRVYVGGAGIASELGHLRPGTQADSPRQIVELAASGWAIADAARADARLASELERRTVARPSRLRPSWWPRPPAPAMRRRIADLSPRHANLRLGHRADDYAAVARGGCYRRRRAAGRRGPVLRSAARGG